MLHHIVCLLATDQYRQWCDASRLPQHPLTAVSHPPCWLLITIHQLDLSPFSLQLHRWSSCASMCATGGCHAGYVGSWTTPNIHWQPLCLSLSLSLSPDVIPALVQPPSDKTSLKVSGHHHYVRWKQLLPCCQTFLAPDFDRLQYWSQGGSGNNGSSSIALKVGTERTRSFFNYLPNTLP